MPSGDAGMSQSISGMWPLGVAFCPLRLASGQGWGKLRYSQTSWGGGWASQQLNHLCVPPWGFQENMSHSTSALQKRDLLGSPCFPSGGVSSVQRKPHRALIPTLILKVENLAYQNELYITKCSSVLYPHSNSSFPQTPPLLTSGSHLTPLLSSPISNIEAAEGQGSVFPSKPHKQQ